MNNIPTEYQVYLHPDFDPQAFANSVLNNEPYLSTDLSKISSGDVNSVLSKLNLGIEEITKQLRSEVTNHHLKLLTKASSIASLDGSIQAIKNGLHQIELNIERLQKKIGSRYTSLETALTSLDRYQTIAELTRRTSRFVTLAKRLETQMIDLDLLPSSNLDPHQPHHRPHQSKPQKDQVEIILAESALTLSELEKLLDSEFESNPNGVQNHNDDENTQNDHSPNPNSQFISSIRSLKVIQPHIQTIILSRKKVEDQMSKILYQGLLQLDRSLLSSSFQTAYNLSILDQSIGSLMLELTESITKRIKLTFDINSLAREAGLNESNPTNSSFGYKSRSRTEPTSNNLTQWMNLLWNKLEGLIDDLTTCCIKVYTLEKVLEWKKDPITGVQFLNVITNTGSILEERPSTVFWTTLSNSLTKETRETLRASNFISQTLTANYPHLLRLFHDFFSKISIHTNTVYNSSHQSPETILTLRSVLPIETIYLNKSMIKMNEASNSNPNLLVGGNGGVDKFIAVLLNELDAARFDPLLVRSVARKVKEVMENYLKRMESRLITDYQSTSLFGPVATSSQITNIQIYNNLSQLSIVLSQSIQEYPQDVKQILEPSIQLTDRIRDGIMDPILVSIKREISMVMAKMHHYHSRINPSSSSLTTVPGGGGSGSGVYMIELRSKFNLIRNEILGRLNNTQLIESLLIKLTQDFLRIFLFHASLMAPLTESLKLRLTADLAEFEFEISQFLLINHPSTSAIQHQQHSKSLEKHDNNKINQKIEDDTNDDDNDNEEGEDQVYLMNQLNNLKIFRQLIFSDQVNEVENLIDQSSLDRLIILHHLIIKHQSEEQELGLSSSSSSSSSSINNIDDQSKNNKKKRLLNLKLIHQIHSWNEAEYLRWVEEYTKNQLITNPSTSISCSLSFNYYSSEPIKILRKFFNDRLIELGINYHHDQQEEIGQFNDQLNRLGKWVKLIFQFLNQEP